MRNLLVKQETQSPLASEWGIQPLDHSGRLVGLALGLDRKNRYEKMVERIYGEPGAANHLLLKTLCLSIMDDPAENRSEA